MKLIDTIIVSSGDCPVPVAVQWWRAGKQHELRCCGNVLRLRRRPKRVDLLLVADPRYCPDSARFL